MDTTKLLLEMDERFQFKKEKIKPLEIYLGGRLEKRGVN